jgi:predicted acyltransferase (DUF342 family)
VKSVSKMTLVGLLPSAGRAATESPTNTSPNSDDLINMKAIVLIGCRRRISVLIMKRTILMGERVNVVPGVTPASITKIATATKVQHAITLSI